MDQVESEINVRMSIRTNSLAHKISGIYNIPVESLIMDMTDVEDHLCKGIKGDKTRCLKKPVNCGFCGFHQKQIPAPKPVRHERIPCPWEET